MTLRIYGNRPLRTLNGLDTRPTLARVREALFNIWQSHIADCRWLDLCTGTGSMGAEALCRGAALVVGIEKSSAACRVIRENWQRVAQPSQSFHLHHGDLLHHLPRLASQQFDRIYFDPPYDSPLYQPTLTAIAVHHLLAPGGELAVEHRPNQSGMPAVSPLRVCREKRYGNTALTFYTLDPETASLKEAPSGG